MPEQPKSKTTERSLNFLKATQVLHKAQKLVHQQQEVDPIKTKLRIYRHDINTPACNLLNNSSGALLWDWIIAWLSTWLSRWVWPGHLAHCRRVAARWFPYWCAKRGLQPWPGTSRRLPLQHGCWVYCCREKIRIDRHDIKDLIDV